MVLDDRTDPTIHMNGRAYDYNLGRFLSVDPFIQFVGNSQSVNPYTYILNNPLAGTDPTGYEGTGIRQEQSMMYENPEFGAELKELRIKQAEGALEAVILIDTVSDYAAPVKGLIKKGVKETAKAIINKFKNIKSNGKDSTVKNKSGDPSKIGSKPAEDSGIVYKRTDNNGGKDYYGQAKSEERYAKRQKEHARDNPDADYEFEEVTRAKPGDQLDVAEHKAIQKATGGVRAKDSPKVANKKDPVGPARRKEKGLPEPKREPPKKDELDKML